MLPASAEGNAPPTASFTVSPNPAAVTREIVLDASGSSDPDGAIARYDWDLNGDGEFEALGGSSPRRVVAFAVPGERVVGLRVLDAQGATATTTRTVVVRANARPTARFTATPNPAQVGQPIGLNASGSSDPEGAIARYEWDLDGNGSFETATARFDPERLVRDGGRTTRGPARDRRRRCHRQHDRDGQRGRERPPTSRAAWLAHTSAFPASPPAALGHASRARPASLPFTARLTGGPLPGLRAQPRRHGARISLDGVRRTRSPAGPAHGRPLRA